MSGNQGAYGLRGGNGSSRNRRGRNGNNGGENVNNRGGNGNNRGGNGNNRGGNGNFMNGNNGGANGNNGGANGNNGGGNGNNGGGNGNVSMAVLEYERYEYFLRDRKTRFLDLLICMSGLLSLFAYYDWNHYGFPICIPGVDGCKQAGVIMFLICHAPALFWVLMCCPRGRISLVSKAEAVALFKKYPVLGWIVDFANFTGVSYVSATLGSKAIVNRPVFYMEFYLAVVSLHLMERRRLPLFGLNIGKKLAGLCIGASCKTLHETGLTQASVLTLVVSLLIYAFTTTGVGSVIKKVGGTTGVIKKAGNLMTEMKEVGGIVKDEFKDAVLAGLEEGLGAVLQG